MMTGHFDNGILCVIVPEGWKLFYGIDSDGNKSPKKLHIYKGAETETDIYSKPGITVCFFEKNEIYISTKSFYDNVCDTAPLKFGNHIWYGYTCTSLGYPYTMLDANDGGATLQVMILMSNGGQSISLEDEDVKIILESLKPSK